MRKQKDGWHPRLHAYFRNSSVWGKFLGFINDCYVKDYIFYIISYFWEILSYNKYIVISESIDTSDHTYDAHAYESERPLTDESRQALYEDIASFSKRLRKIVAFT